MSLDADVARLRSRLTEWYPAISRLEPESNGVDEGNGPPTGFQTLVRASQRPSLFPYQADLSRAMSKATVEGGSALLAMPTGAGKTRTAMFSILDSLTNGTCGRVVWLAPTIELVEQAASTLGELWREFGNCPDFTLAFEFDPVIESRQHAVLVTTPQAVHARVARHASLMGPWDLVVFDEAHQVVAETFRLAVDELRAGPSPTALIGLSATPGRVDSAETDDLVDLFGRRLLTSRRLRPNPVRTLQRQGILSRLEFKRITDVNPDTPSVPKLRSVIEHVAALAQNRRRVLLFNRSVAEAVVSAEALASLGIPAGCVHGGLGRERRSELISGFAEGRIGVLTNQKVLATGYDCPGITDVVLAARIGSPIQFEQIVGRVARGPRTGGTSVGTVWEIDNHLELHGLPQSYYRFKDFDWIEQSDQPGA